jgi:hypothetical protein
MNMKRGSRSKPVVAAPTNLGEVMAEICAPAKPEVAQTESRTSRSRRAGPFKVPASMAGAPSTQREGLARRFKQHLKGVSGANKLGPDPDETVPVVKPGSRSARPNRPGFSRSGFGERPSMMSRLARPSVPMSDDEDD